MSGSRVIVVILFLGIRGTSDLNCWSRPTPLFDTGVSLDSYHCSISKELSKRKVRGMWANIHVLNWNEMK
jgi:hypothetical protein